MKQILQITIISVLACISIGASAQLKEQRNLESFNKISVKGGFNVVLKKGTKESVVIESKKTALDKIKTTVSDNTLKIDTDGNRWSSSNDEFNITVTYQKLDEIKNSGSSDITCSDELTSKNFVANVTGSGNMSLNTINSTFIKANVSGSGDLDIKSINATSVKISIAGSGNIRVAGKTASEDLNIAGSGDIHAFNLQTDTSDVSIAGSGDIKVSVSNYLNVRIAGSGDVTYKGDAKIGKLSIMGSGDIRKAE